MADADRMTLGQIVDFCEAYNERQERAEQAASGKGKKQQKPKKRKATQSEIDAFFG